MPRSLRSVPMPLAIPRLTQEEQPWHFHARPPAEAFGECGLEV